MCTQCGEQAKLTPTEIEQTVKVAGRTFVGAVRGLRCPKCKAELIVGPDLGHFELTVAAELAKDGPTNADTLKYMRKAGLGLKATELACLLDVSPETLSRWETGALPIQRQSWALVASLVLERLAGTTTLRTALETLAQPSPRKPHPKSDLPVGRPASPE